MEEEALFQLIYISRASVEFSQQELGDLLEKSRSNNQKVGIGGLLIYEKGDFIQVLEGPKSEVLKTFDRIKKDHRHSNVKKLLLQKIEEKEFSNWKMGFLRPNKEFPLPQGYQDIRGIGEAGGDATTVKKALSGFLSGRWRPQID